MERMHVAILVVIIIYSNITIYALKMYKERARLENSHYQKGILTTVYSSNYNVCWSKWWLQTMRWWEESHRIP